MSGTLEKANSTCYIQQAAPHKRGLLRGLDIAGIFYSFFFFLYITCDFLYTFLDITSLVKNGLLKKERMCSPWEPWLQILSF